PRERRGGAGGLIAGGLQGVGRDQPEPVPGDIAPDAVRQLVLRLDVASDEGGVEAGGGGHAGDRSPVRSVTGDNPPPLPGIALAESGVRAGSGVADCRGVVRRSAEGAAAVGPRAGALAGEHALADLDLLLLGGLVGGRGELVAAVAGPGLGGELQAALVAVAGVDVPVAAGLALRHLLPGAGARGGRGRGCHGGSAGCEASGERGAGQQGDGLLSHSSTTSDKVSGRASDPAETR